MVTDPYEPELSDKAEEILCLAAVGSGNNQGLIEFVLPREGGLLNDTPDVRGIASCAAGDETIKESELSHRASLEYKAAAGELVRALLAERIDDDTYRLTLTGYRRADTLGKAGDRNDG